MKTVKRLHEQAKTSTEDHPPVETNYLKADNPYKARYGDRWKEVIKNVTSMRKYVCVTDMVQFMHDETAKIFKGTPYEDTYLFYHGVLSTMTDKDCIKWMEEKGILKRWIRPVYGLNNVIVIIDDEGKEKRSEHYGGRPVGNCPEIMPQDNSLFCDFRCSFDTHVTLTCLLPKYDIRRFSKAAPRLIQSAVKRLWDPDDGVAPSSKRIVQDILRLAENLQIIVENYGAVVPGVADRNGHRKLSNTNDENTLRPYYPPHEDQTAVGLEYLDLHKDCLDVVQEFYYKEIALFEQSNNQTNPSGNKNKNTFFTEPNFYFEQGVAVKSKKTLSRAKFWISLSFSACF